MVYIIQKWKEIFALKHFSHLIYKIKRNEKGGEPTDERDFSLFFFLIDPFPKLDWPVCYRVAIN